MKKALVGLCAAFLVAGGGGRALANNAGIMKEIHGGALLYYQGSQTDELDGEKVSKMPGSHRSDGHVSAIAHNAVVRSGKPVVFWDWALSPFA